MTKRALCLALLTCGPTALAQTVWSPVSPAPAPSPRSDVAMVFDANRDRIVLSGGWSGRVDLADTWEWDGAGWRDVTPSPAANRTPHSSHRMVFDRARDLVVSFGGWNAGSPSDETWTWDGARWTRLTPAARPTPRASHAMAYDVARDRIVLFGGWDGVTGLGDTWEFDGAAWHPRSPGSAPTPRYSAAMSYDPIRQRCVLFGGRTGNGRSDELWEWDGASWQLRQPAVRPPGRSSPAFAYDAARERLVVFGGFDGLWRSDTWEWDGATWHARPGVAPAGRGFAAMAYDATRECAVLFGGDAGRVLGDQWCYAPTHAARVTITAAGCAGLGIDLLHTSRPWLGEDFAVAVAGVAPATASTMLAVGGSASHWNGLQLPFDLAAVGMTGCMMRAAADAILVAPARGGRSTISIAVPNSPALLGALVHAQGFARAPGANPTGVAVTERLDAVLGGK